MQVLKTDEFSSWLIGLRDRQARNAVLARIDRLLLGNAGDARSVGSGVSEMRIHHGPGYRIYFVRRGLEFIILLAGGDKSTQREDIQKAIRQAKQL